MTARALTSDEYVGLTLAALGHAVLVAGLVLYKPAAPLPQPPRMTVTLSDIAGPVSTSPDPAANPAPDKGPELGEPAPEPEAVTPPEPAPAPAPAPKVPPKPPQQVQKTPAKWPFAPPQQTQKSPPKAPPAKTPTTRPGASVLDPGYEKGLAGGSGKGKSPPAEQASAQTVASWSSLIGNKVARPWNACPVSGLDVGKLRATVRFTLDRNGRILSIEPFDVTGVTDANRNQVEPFRKCVNKSLQLAAPFTGLPPEFYDQWKSRKLNFYKK